MLIERWKIHMLGGLAAQQGAQTIDRFRTRKGGELLVALALHLNHGISREELLALLWPDEEGETGRNRLRVELAALRRQFQTPKQASIQMIEAYRLGIRLHPEAFTTDVAEFEQRLSQAAQAGERPEQTALWRQAVELYRGDLLPAYDTEWIVTERMRLAALHQETLRRLIRRLAQERDFDQAIAYAQRALQFDAWNEEAHFDLIRLLVAVGQPTAAIRQYETLEQTLREQFAARPAAAVREFIQQVQVRLGHTAGARAKAFVESPAPTSPPPVATVPTSFPAIELPVRLTQFFGREREMDQLASLLKANRLVTVTGLGGNGKTRLTIETAAPLQEAFPGGIRFLYLGDLLEIGSLPDALRQTLHLPAQPGTPPLDQVIAALSTAPSLLILDNFEHLVDQGASLVQTLLEMVPALTLAVTSRRVLGVAGEQEFPLAPLPTPPMAQEPEALNGFASIRLFIDRAQAVRPDFQLNSRNAEAIASLCRYLEGIPLALELAAARIRTMTVSQMAAGLMPRLELLVNPRADKDARHRSLHTTIAWSVQMLSPEARRFFTRLAVFQGGWDVQGAAQVCLSMEPAGNSNRAPLETSRWSAFDLLERLLSESLLMAEERNGVMRFRMLETLREFAWEQLPPAEQERMHYRHAAYYMHFAEEMAPGLNGPELLGLLNRLEEERTNLTAALTWCLNSQQRDLSPSPNEIGLRLAGSLWKFWDMRGGVPEGRQILERLLKCAEPHLAPQVLARACATAAGLAKSESAYLEALAHAEQALAHWKQAGNKEGIGLTLSNMGTYYSEQGNLEESLRYYEEALIILREVGIPWRIATTLNNIGGLQRMRGEFDAAEANLQDALTLRRQIGDLRAVWSTLYNLATLAHHRGDHAAALQGQGEALAMARALEDRHAIALSLVNLGFISLSLQDYPAAYRCFLDSLQLQTEVGNRFGQAHALEGLAMHAVLTELPERAGVLLGATQSLRHTLRIEASSQQQEALDKTFLPVAADPLFLNGLQRGSSLSLDDALSLAVLPVAGADSDTLA